MASEYSLVVIGAGPSGQMAAKKAALLGRKVAVVDTMTCGLTPQRRMRKFMFRIYALEDAGILNPITFCKPRTDISSDISSATENEHFDLLQRIERLFRDDTHDAITEAAVTRTQLKMRNLTLIEGRAKFLNLDELEVETSEGKIQVLEPSNVIIATGSHFLKDESIAFDQQLIFDGKSIFNINPIPKSIVIVGDHVVPTQFAIAFALMGSQVTLLVSKKSIFEGLDEEIDTLLLERMNAMGIIIGFQTEKEEIEKNPAEGLVNLKLTNGNTYTANALLWLADRIGNTNSLECDAAGVEFDYKGNIVVDQQFRTSTPHIYAVGDVVTAPMYESVRKDQGRMAAALAFGLKDTEQLSEAYPVGIYALPEVAFYGLTEADAKKHHIRCIIGKTYYRDIPYGRLCDQNYGMLKIVVNRDTEEIIGVHIIGRSAQEIIHFGMQLIEDKVRVSRVIGTILNGTTLHELYHFAALNAHEKIK